MSSDINNTFNFYKFKNLQEYQNTDTNQFEEILEVKFYNQKGELYSVMVGIMTAVIIAVSYIIPNISFNFPLDSWAKEGRMNDVCWISSSNCTIL